MHFDADGPEFGEFWFSSARVPVAAAGASVARVRVRVCTVGRERAGECAACVVEDFEVGEGGSGWCCGVRVVVADVAEVVVAGAAGGSIAWAGCLSCAG